MKISVDAGALCAGRLSRFGNYFFTKNFIQAINLYDLKNEYCLYSFCQKPKWLIDRKNFYYQKLTPSNSWMNLRVSIEELINKKDIFLALNQAIPLFTSSKIISFCHGLSYYFYPQYYPDSSQKLKQQLNRMIERSSYIVVSSQKVKEELTTVFRNSEVKIKVLPFGIPFDMLRQRLLRNDNKGRFFLHVGMNHPIKNIPFIKNAFKIFKSDKKYKDYKLICVTGGTSREKLNELYQKATALLTASYYESFNLPVLEALSQGCPVIGLKEAVIPEFKPFINVADNEKEFIEKIRMIAAGGGREINVKRLKKILSWENYVKNLINLYTSMF